MSISYYDTEKITELFNAYIKDGDRFKSCSFVNNRPYNVILETYNEQCEVNKTYITLDPDMIEKLFLIIKQHKV